MKKIKCDGGTPCNKCLSIGFDCTTSDKLSRRAFPKGYTVNLEKRIAELEDENAALKAQMAGVASSGLLPPLSGSIPLSSAPPSLPAAIKLPPPEHTKPEPSNAVTTLIANLKNIQINNPIDQIFNLDQNGIIIGNDNLNFESQFNHMLINLNLPFLKITNSHNYLTNDPDSYLYHPSYSSYNDFHNKDLGLIYNPLTVDGRSLDLGSLINTQLPRDVYDLFIKLINNLKKIFASKKELDVVVVQFFLNFNTFIPILDYTEFMKSYDAFHTMYPFMFTYDDATINGFNLTNDYNVVNEHLIVVIQIYAMILMTDPTLNLNLLLNHSFPNYAFLFRMDRRRNESIVKSLYDFLPYLNAFHCSLTQLQTYLLLFYYSLLTNNKEKSLALSAMINAYMGILGINLNAKSLFFNDLSLSLQQRRDRVKIFWSFKVLLKCFNLKFGFKPSINTTVINPVTIDQYFKLTPDKLSTLLDTSSGTGLDALFQTLLKPSVEFLNLLNIIIPSSFSPNYYQYLKNEKPPGNEHPSGLSHRRPQSNNLDWILNDDDGDGNDGNLNYNYTQFLTIDTNLSNWRYSLREKTLDLTPLHTFMGLPMTPGVSSKNLYQRITFDGDLSADQGISEECKRIFSQTGLPDASTAAQLIRMQLNLHYLLIRSLNYLNFVIERELTPGYYVKIANIARETLAYFVLMFEHLTQAMDQPIINHGDGFDNSLFADSKKMMTLSFPTESGIHVEDDGFIINDFSAKRRKVDIPRGSSSSEFSKEIPASPFNGMLNGLSLTIINFKKSIALQMLYLLICTLKVAKKGGVMSNDTIVVLNKSINLFIRIFINYRPNANKNIKVKKVKEDDLFKKIINDELKDEFLTSKNVESDDDDDDNDIDWDDEEMDEDLKYLKILKYIKYKTSHLHEKYINKWRSPSEQGQSFTGPMKGESKIKNEGVIPGASQVAHHAPLGETRDGQNGFPHFNQVHGDMFPSGGLGKMSSFSTLDFMAHEHKTEAGQSEAIASELMNIKRGNRAYASPWQHPVAEGPTPTMNDTPQ